ncbi:MAG: tyrosine-protein phosphatase [Coriobacteriales bacterium]|jgi:hypothetical protein
MVARVGQGSSGGGASEVRIESLPVMRDTNFGSVCLDVSIDDFNRSGFSYGDSLTISFSNGFGLGNIPYYNGYYAGVGDPLLAGYPGSPFIKAALNYGDSLWQMAGLGEGDTATVALREAGAYRSVQETFDISYTNNRDDYDTDQQFANFRACAGGRMRPGHVFRSASPVDNEYNRVPYASALMRDAGVAFILNLSDNPGEVDRYVAESTAQGIDMSYFHGLRDAGKVAMLDLTASFPSDEFARSLAGGFAEMGRHEGPYLVHCIEGKDRTGFACVLLEALCGATYDEMLADYMETYANYYDFTRESDPDRFDAIAGLNLDGMLRFLADADDWVDLRSIDYDGPVRAYLRRGGMSKGEIDALVARLCD